MRKLLSLAVVLALPLATSAAERDCLVSFSGAEQDVCTGNATTAAPTLQGLLSLDAVADSTLRLVKFNGPITTEQRAAVEAAGARILSYAPHYAYIVRMSPSRDTAMKAIDGVTWSGPLLPALKVDPNIYNQLQSGGIVEGLDIDSLEISIDTDASRGDVRSAFASVRGLSVTNVVESAGELRVRAMFAPSLLSSAVEELALRDDVVAVSFRRPMRLSNSQGHWLHQSGKNTPTPQMPIWNKGLYGCGQIVGELDTGLYMDNVAFKDASQNLPISVCTTGTSCTSITPNLNARKVVSYYKWSGLSGGSWADNHGHGTHVAGSIIGNDNVANPGTDCANFTTPGGDTNLDGMAPGAKLVMQESGGNLAYLNTMGGTPYHAADIAYQNGARIHSNSWGGGCTNQFGQCVSGCTITYDESSRDADKIMQDRSDLLMVFAAGNDARACPNGNNVGSPGNAKNVLTIGGNARGTNGNNTYTSSSRGPTLDSRTKPDLTAQAVGIISASRTTNGTTAMSGTSMATPTAAGNAALVRDYLARGFYPSGVKTPADAIPNPSGALVKAIMAAGAFKMTGSGVGVNPGQDQGFGRILLDDSLYFAGDASQLYIQDATGGLATGGTANYSVNVTGPERLTFILTWSDVAAAVNASPATVNSLRLEVQAPNGDVWTQKLPAGYNVNNADPTQSTATSNYDDINTLQRIQFDTPTPGTYQIRVRGINVPQGPQKFALAATGTFIPGGVTTYTVTPSVGTQSGTISPATPQTVSEGSSATFTLAPASGFQVDNVGGTCGGTLTGLSYVTNAVTANCTVIANFKVADANSLVCSNTINHAIANNIDGTSVNWITGDIQDADVSGYHFNPYNNSNQLTFWWQTGAPNIAGVSSSATSSDFRVLQDGAVVGPSSIWSTTNNPGPAAWAAGADGYLGFRFDCSTLPTAPANGICYGYVHLKTTAPNGFPATLVDYCYDKAGNAVTIGGGTPGGDPVASITPTAISLSAEQGTSDSKPLTIANTGGGSLTYTITESAVARPTSSFATASLRTDKLGNAISGTLSANPNAVNGALGRPVTLLATDISQMTDNTPGDEGVSCGQQSTSTADNSWWRRFYFNEHPAVGASATVQSVKVSTGSISIPSGVPSTINLYTLPHSTPVNTIPTGSLTLIGTANFTATGSLQTITVPVTGAIDDTAGKDLVVEWHTEGNASGGQFFPGANASPQTHPTFISSAACSITDPTATADINFPDFHLTMVVTLDDGGTQPEPGCDNPSDIPWLSATPTSGAVAGGSSSTVTVAGNAGSMAAGSYTANVCVATNDPTHAMTAVPVTLNVTQGSGSGLTCNTVNHAIAQSFDGTYVKWETGEFSDTGSIAGANFNPYDSSGLAFFWPNSGTGNAGVASSTGTTWLVLQAGDVVGPSQTFSTATGAATNWRAGVDGYLGFRFSCSTASACYGYAHMTTTAGTGFPATIESYCYDPTGAAVTIGGGGGGGDPTIAVTPASMTASQATGATTTQTLSIKNAGGGLLNWNITEQNTTALGAMPNQAHAAQPASERVGAAVNRVPAPQGNAGRPWAVPMASLYDNGPLVTNAGAGAGGKDASALQTSVGNSAYGSNVSASAGFRAADDFVVPAGGWTVDTMTFFTYQTGSTTTSTINGVNVRIWNGPPGASGSTIVFGDTTTNRMASTAFSNIYRVLDTALTNTDRPLMAVVANIGTTLPACTYWVDWQLSGTLASGPWAPPVTLVGQTGKPGANAVQNDGSSWIPAMDDGSGAQQDFPFLIEGTAGGGGTTACSTTADMPWLSLSATSGSTAAGVTTPVTVTFNSTGLAAGTYTGNLCVASNDTAHAMTVVPVSMAVTPAGTTPTIAVTPASVSGTAAAGASTTVPLTIANTGAGTLTWNITEAAARGPYTPSGVAERQSPRVTAPRAPFVRDWAAAPLAEAIQDGGFELGDPNPFWDTDSLNFGTVLCDSSCSNSPENAPHSGSWWAWFGGIDSFETGMVSQQVTIPSGGATLKFWVRVPFSSGLAADFLKASVDGTEVWRVTADAAGAYQAAYQQVTVDVSAFADGGTHTVRFDSTVVGGGSETSNFMLDDVSLETGTGGGSCTAVSDVPWLSATPASGSTTGGSSTAVSVGLNAAGLTAGTYTANLCVNSNDAANPVVTVPVSFTVTGSGTGDPIAEVTPASFDFTVDAGDTGTDTMVIANIGGGTLTYAITEAEFDRNPPSYKTAAARKATDVDGAVIGNLSSARSLGASRFGEPVQLLATDISQMTDNTPGDEGVSCGQQATSTADNSWWRRFYFNEHANVGASANVTSVKVSTGSIAVPGGVPSTINLYTIPHSVTVNTIPTGQLTLIGTANFTATGSLQTITVPVTGAIDDTVGKDLVVEWHTDGNESGGQFFPGANASAESHPTFLSSSTCGISTPTPASAIDFPDFHLTMVVTLDDGGSEPQACDSPSNIPWLSATPASGSVAAGMSSDVAVSVDASALTPGSYSANLCVATNDPIAPMIPVPVTLTVEAGSDDGIFCSGFEEGENGSCGEGEPPVDENVVVSGPINVTIPETIDGLYINFVTGQTSPTEIPGYDFDPYKGSSKLLFYWAGDVIPGANGGVAATETGPFLVLGSGAVIGPSSTFSASANGANNETSAFLAGVEGYLGVKFLNEATGETNYGYVHIRTTAGSGFPATILDYAYDKSGAAITIP